MCSLFKKSARPEARYVHWWLRRYCRLAGSTAPYRLVTSVAWVGPPSGVYGDVWLTYESGEREVVQHGDAFKPRRRDVEVLSDKKGET